MKGIFFKPDMIKAIVRDVNPKTVTRRLDHLKEINLEPDKWHFVTNAVRDIPPIRIGGCLFECQGSSYVPDGHQIWINPRYHAGETVYVKEPHYAFGEWYKESRGWVFYRDEEMAVIFDNAMWGHALKGHQGIGWYRRSPLFLPTKDARTFLKIKDVRAERLQELTDEDAFDEGMSQDIATHLGFSMESFTKDGGDFYRHIYKRLWDSINPKYPFSSNPWDFRIEFEKTDKPEAL